MLKLGYNITHLQTDMITDENYLGNVTAINTLKITPIVQHISITTAKNDIIKK